MERKRVDVYHHSSNSNDEKVRTCGWCKGKGTVRDHITGRKKMCDVCFGKGKNRFKGTPELCPTCKGTGAKRSFLMNARIKCEVCKGRGYNEISYDEHG